MREGIERALETALRWALYCTLFLLPLKFGVPYLEQETYLFPYSFWDWLVLPYWPLEFFIWIPLGLFFVWGIKSFLAGRLLLRWNRALTLACLFLTAVFLAQLLSVYPYASKILSQQMAAYVLLFFLAVQLASSEKMAERAAMAFIAGATLLALYGLYQHFFGLQATLDWLKAGGGEEKVPANVLSRLKGGRAFATFIYPNSLAGYLLLAFPIGLSLWIWQWKSHRSAAFIFCGSLLATALLIILILGVETPEILTGSIVGTFLYPLSLLTALGVTFSKGGILALLVLGALFVFWFFLRSKENRQPSQKFNWLVWGIVLLLIGISFTLALSYQEFWSHRIRMGTFQERWGYWSAAWQMLASHPILGTGPGTFGAVYPCYKSVGAADTQLAHNDYLQLAAETGLLGFLLYAGFLGFILFAGWRALWRRPNSLPLHGMFWGCAGLALHHLSDFDFYVPAIGGCESIFLGILSVSFLRQRASVTPFPNFLSRFVFFVGIVAATFLLGSTLTQQLQARYAFDLARRSVQAEDIAGALEWADRALKKEKGNALMAVFQGRLWLRKGSPEKALASYERAQTLHPYWATPYLLELEIRREEWKKSSTPENQQAMIQVWRKAIDRQPSEIAFRLKLAQFLENLGMLEEALLEYKAILLWDPAHTAAQERARELGRQLSERFKDMA